MNLEQLKKKVAEINKSTATSHPKVMVAALCVVIQELIEKVEHLTKPKITLTSPEQVTPIETPQIPVARPEQPLRTPPLVRPNRNRKFNAGDAE